MVESISIIRGQEINWDPCDVDILQEVVNGKDNPDIARRLDLRPTTVAAYKTLISIKFGGNLNEDALGIAIVHAVKNYLIDAEGLPEIPPHVGLTRTEARALTRLMTEPQVKSGIADLGDRVALKSVRTKFGVLSDYQAVAVGARELKRAGYI